MIPKQIFFTKGEGIHKDKLISFEMALRDAGLAPYNLVTVSSILPPNAKIISREEGLSQLSPGEIVYCVLARTDTNIPNQAISASIGVAVPKCYGNHHGYLSEYHATNMPRNECGKYAEYMATNMLATIMNIDTSSNDLNNIIKTNHIVQSSVGADGMWTTVIVAAVFVM